MIGNGKLRVLVRQFYVKKFIRVIGSFKDMLNDWIKQFLSILRMF